MRGGGVARWCAIVVAGACALPMQPVQAAAADSAVAFPPEQHPLANQRLAEPGADAVRAVAAWVQASGDNAGLPYAIVDKQRARLMVFEADGRLIGDSAALLGAMPGDFAVPGTGAKPLADILPAERTTPAGRYATEPGRNLGGEAVVWLDYDAGLAIHRVRPGPAEERRLERLASATAADNRVSLGCVVVDVAFYLGVVEPVLGKSRGVAYVLPETRSLAEVFGPSWRLGLQQPAR